MTYDPNYIPPSSKRFDPDIDIVTCPTCGETPRYLAMEIEQVSDKEFYGGVISVKSQDIVTGYVLHPCQHRVVSLEYDMRETDDGKITRWWTIR